MTFPATGAKAVPGSPTQDANWTIVGNTLAGESGSGAAAIVTNLPNGWVKTDPGTTWISVQPDQTNATRPGTCCVGESHYQVTFNVADPATAVLQFKVAGDEDMDIYLNGFDTNRVIYSSTGPTYSNPVNVTAKQGATYVDPGGYSHLVQFQKGLNTLLVVVGNLGGGPTGIYLSPVNPAPIGPASYTNTSPAAFGVPSLTDPVDSASGQFYDTATDFRLGGPMQLKFERYYSSFLSGSGVASALGTNWMTNYDLSALVNGTKAQVLLFGGLVVTFNNIGGPWQLASPLTRNYQFATVSGGYQFMNPSERLIYSFSSTGVLTKIEDRNGNAITVTQGANGPSKVSDGLGRALTFTYSGSQLASVQDQAGRTASFAYANGLLASATDAAKAVTTYSYTTAGAKTALLTKETLPLGNAPVTQTYDATGRVVTQSGPTNNVSRLNYNGVGGTTIADPLGGVALQQNDSAGNLLQSIDAAGNMELRTYDANRRLASLTDRTGATLQYGYDGSGEITAVTDPYGNTASLAFLPQTKGPFTFYDLSSAQSPGAAATTGLTYDANGNMLSLTLPGQPSTQFGYDANGKIVQATNALSNSTNYSWNADATVASVQDAAGNVTKFEYDSLKRPSKATDPNGRVEQYSYDAAGRDLTYQLPGEAAWQQHFNANGMIDSVTNSLGGQTTFTFNTAGLLDTQTDPLKNSTVFTYDAANRVKKVQLASGEFITYTRDAGGHITAAADANGPLQQFTYDGEGHVLTQTDATQRTTNFAYTKTGELMSVTSPSGGMLAFGYDAQGNLTSRTHPLGDGYTITYDPLGQLTGITGPGGFSTSLVLDAMGKPTSMTSANGNTWSMTYDPLERITKMTDPLGNATGYVYQGVRLSEIDFPLGAVNYIYDALGRVTSAQYSDGTLISATYNDMGQILTSNHLAIERNTLGQMTKVNGIAITRDAAGRPLTMTYATGKAVSYTYDKSGRVDSVSDWTGGKTVFTYDKASRRTSQTLPSGVATAFDYNPDGRLSGITYGTLGAIQLTYDANGRITSADRNVPLAPALHDAVDQFSFNAAGQLSSATYDSMGRVTAQGTRSYSWDLASELTGFADPVNSATMTYDGALGEMWSSTASGAAQTYVFNYAMHYPALSIVRQGGSDVRYYVYLPDGELLYSIDAKDGSRSFYHFDELGNTAFLTDSSGAVTDTYAITPYGEVTDHIGTSDNPFTWQGQYGTMQEATGLFYMRSRHYDATSARFLSPDPLMDSEPQSSEPYAYGRGNPMLYTDPFGAGWLDGLANALNGVKNAISGVVHKVVAVVQGVVSKVVHQAPVAQVKAVVQAPPAVTPVLVVPTPVVVLQPSVPVVNPLISQDGNSLQWAVANGVISNDGATLILKLEGVISNDGGTLTGLSELISQDGNGLRALVNLIGQDGNGLTHWAQLISQDGNNLLAIQRLIGQDGNGLLANTQPGLLAGGAAGLFSNGATSFGGYTGGASLLPRSYKLATLGVPPKPKNNKN